MTSARNSRPYRSSLSHLLFFRRSTGLAEPDWPVWAQRLSLVVGLSLAVLPLAVVWDYGGVLPRTVQLIFPVAVALSLISLPLLVVRRGRVPSRLVVLPALSLAAWAMSAFQTVPLPLSLVGWLAPASASIYRDWRPEAMVSELGMGAGSVDWAPISVCASLTRGAASGFMLFGLVGWVASLVLRDRRVVVWMMALVAIGGATVAFVAILDQVRAPTPAGTVAWITPEVKFAAPYGPFVNKNNAACFFNLALACSLGLLIRESLRNAKQTGDERYQLPPENILQDTFEWLGRVLREATAPSLFWAVVSAVLLAAVFASGSRGGMLAAIAGTAALITRGRHRRRLGWGMIAVTMVAISAAFLLETVNLSAAVQGRFASIFTLDEGSQVGRLMHWRESLPTGLKYAPMGGGVGAYRYAHLQNSSSGGGSWFHNADCMPLEWWVEGGIWMIALVIIGLYAWYRAILHLQINGRRTDQKGLAATGWFALVAMIVSQCFDFGILLPANYLLLATLSGAIVAAGSRPAPWRSNKTCHSKELEQPLGYDRIRLDRSSSPTGDLGRVASVLLGGALVLATYISYDWTGQSTLAQQIVADGHALTTPPAPQRRRPLPDDELPSAPVVEFAADPEWRLNLIVRLRQIAEFAANSEVDVVLGNALLEHQRRLAIEQVKRSEPTADAQSISILTRTDARRALYYGAHQRGFRSATPADALLPAQSLNDFEEARRAAWRAIRDCPLDLQARGLLLQTSFVAGGGDPLERHRPLCTELLDQVVQLWPNNPAILESAARLAFVYPGYSSAAPIIANVLADQPSAFSRLWPMIQMGETVELQLKSFPEHAEVIVLAINSRQLPGDLQSALIARAQRLLGNPDQVPDPARRHYLRGELARLSGDTVLAETLLRVAVRDAPAELQYRLALAELLASLDNWSAAHEEFRRALLQAPTNGNVQRRYRESLERINRRPVPSE